MNFSTKLKWQFIWNWMIHFFAMPRCNRPLWLWWLRWRSFRDLESLRQQEGVQTPKWTTSLGKVFEAFLILQNKIVFFCLNQNHLLGMRVSSSLWMASPRSWINSIIFGTSLFPCFQQPSVRQGVTNDCWWNPYHSGQEFLYHLAGKKPPQHTC